MGNPHHGPTLQDPQPHVILERPWVLGCRPCSDEMSTTMTDEARALHRALAELSDACGTLAQAFWEDCLSREEQIEIALMFLDMPDRVLKRLVENSEVVEGDAP